MAVHIILQYYIIRVHILCILYYIRFIDNAPLTTAPYHGSAVRVVFRVKTERRVVGFFFSYFYSLLPRNIILHHRCISDLYTRRSGFSSPFFGRSFFPTHLFSVFITVRSRWSSRLLNFTNEMLVSGRSCFFYYVDIRTFFVRIYVYDKLRSTLRFHLCAGPGMKIVSFLFFFYLIVLEH